MLIRGQEEVVILEVWGEKETLSGSPVTMINKTSNYFYTFGSTIDM